MTRTEVAEALRVTASTVDRWARAGKIKRYHTPGSRPRYKRVEVLALSQRVFEVDDDPGAQAAS